MKAFVACALALSLISALPAAAKTFALETRYTQSEFKKSCANAGGSHIGGANPVCSGKGGDVLCGKPDANGKMGCVFVPSTAAASSPRSGRLSGIEAIDGFSEGGGLLELAPAN